MKLLFILFVSANCMSVEVNECGMTQAQMIKQQLRCFEVSGDEVYESVFDNGYSFIVKTNLTVAQLSNEFDIMN
jgi:hypothetical protein